MGFKVLTAAGAIKEGSATGVDLATATGTLGVTHGGTGDTTITGIIYGTGTAALSTTTIPADATKFLNGAATPAYALVKDSDLSTSDITTNNVSTTKHGFAPKSPNDATKYLDGTGAYSVPAGSGSDGFTVIVASADESFTNTAPQIDGTTDHTQFQFSTTAGKLYMFDMLVAYSGNNATGDWAIRFYVSAGTMDGRGTMQNLTAADAANNLLLSVAGAQSSGSFAGGTTASATTPTTARIAFAFIASNTTTFHISFGNASSSVGRTSYILAGSIMKWKQIST